MFCRCEVPEPGPPECARCGRVVPGDASRCTCGPDAEWPADRCPEHNLIDGTRCFYCDRGAEVVVYGERRTHELEERIDCRGGVPETRAELEAGMKMAYRLISGALASANAKLLSEAWLRYAQEWVEEYKAAGLET